MYYIRKKLSFQEGPWAPLDLQSVLHVFIYAYICVMQEEKEVLALLSRLDMQNVHFTNSPPGMYSSLSFSFWPRAGYLLYTFFVPFLFFIFCVLDTCGERRGWGGVFINWLLMTK
jgi:hypothetical protein